MLPPALTWRRILLGGALLASVVASVWPRSESGPAHEVVPPAARQGSGSGPQPAEHAAGTRELPTLGERLERPPATATVHDLFGATSWNRPLARAQPAPKPLPPSAPPFPYSIAGVMQDGDGPMIVFSRQDQDFALRAGDLLEKIYRVESIAAQSVTVTFLPLGLTQVVPIGR